MLEEVLVSDEQLHELLLENIEEDVEIIIGEDFENFPPLDEDVIKQIPTVNELTEEEVEGVQSNAKRCESCRKPYKRESALKRHMKTCSIKNLGQSVTKAGKSTSKMSEVALFFFSRWTFRGISLSKDLYYTFFYGNILYNLIKCQNQRSSEAKSSA